MGTGETGEADAHGPAAAPCWVTTRAGHRAGHDVAAGLPAAHSPEPGTRTRENHDAKLKPPLRAAAPRLLANGAFSCLSWGPSRALLASALVLTFWQRHAGRGTVDVPLAPWRARSPVGADMAAGN